MMTAAKWCSRKNVVSVGAAACFLGMTVAAGIAVGQSQPGSHSTAGVQPGDEFLQSRRAGTSSDTVAGSAYAEHPIRIGARFTGDIPQAPPIIVDYRKFLGQRPPEPIAVGVASSIPTGQPCDFNIQCNDCDPCTLDSCSAGVCADGPNAGFGCDDDEPCLGQCVGGQCAGDICTSDTECCGDPDQGIENGTCEPFGCQLFGSCVNDECFGGPQDGQPCSENDDCGSGDLCVNAPIAGRFVTGSECDDGLACASSGPQPVCEYISGVGTCVDDDPLTSTSNVCDATSGSGLFGSPCEDDEDCDGGNCLSQICVGGANDGLACDDQQSAPICEDDSDDRCPDDGANEGRCVTPRVSCAALDLVCREVDNSCAARCSSDADCDTDENPCTNDVCCTGGEGDPPQCQGVAPDTCVVATGPCGPGGGCEFDPEQGVFSCSAGRCCNPAETDPEDACTQATFPNCQPPNIWLATGNACDKFVSGGVTTSLDNICPLYSAGLTPPDVPIGTAVGPISFFNPCPQNLRRVGDDYSFNSSSGFAELHAFRWISSVQFPARQTVEFYEREEGTDRPLFSGQTFVPVVGGSLPVSGPILRTVLFEPPMPIPAEGWVAFHDAFEFTNKLGTFSMFTTRQTAAAGSNDAARMLLQTEFMAEPEIFESLGECNGGNRDGLWCDLTNADEIECPGLGGGGTCEPVAQTLAFEIVGKTLADVPEGGCCDISNGACTIKTIAQCLDEGGVFRGVGVGCAFCLGGTENGRTCGPGGDVSITQCEDEGGGTCTERVCELDVQEACATTTDCDQGLNFCVFTGTPNPSGELCPDGPGTCPEGQTCVVNACIDIARCQRQAVCDPINGFCETAACGPEDPPDPDGFGCGSGCELNCCAKPVSATTKKLCDGGDRDLQVCQVDADCFGGGTCKEVFPVCRAPGVARGPEIFEDCAPDCCDPTAPLVNGTHSTCPAGQYCDGIALFGGDNCTQVQVPVVEVPSSASPDVIVPVTTTGNNFLGRFDDFNEGTCAEGPNQGANCTPLEDPTVCGASTPTCARKGGVFSGVGDPDGAAQDPLWWEGFQLTFPNKTAIGDNCAWLRHDFCCTDPAVIPSWAGLVAGCPSVGGVPATGAPPPLGLGRREGDLGRGTCELFGGTGGDNNVMSTFGPAGPGTYYKPVYGALGGSHQPPLTGGVGGIYQNHFAVTACPPAACCAHLCVDGERDGRPYNPAGLASCPGAGAACINDVCVGGVFEGLPCGGADYVEVCADDAECLDGFCDGGADAGKRCGSNFVDQCWGGTQGPRGCTVSNELECLTAGGFFNAQPFLPVERGTQVGCGTISDCAEPESDNPCCLGVCCLGPGICCDGDDPPELEDFCAAFEFGPVTESSCIKAGGTFAGGQQCEFETPPCPVCRVGRSSTHCQPGEHLGPGQPGIGEILAAGGGITDAATTGGPVYRAATSFFPEGNLLREFCWAHLAAQPGTFTACERPFLPTWRIRVWTSKDGVGLPDEVIHDSGFLDPADDTNNYVALDVPGLIQTEMTIEASYTFDPALPVDPNQRYWIDFEGVQTDTCRFMMFESLQGSNFALLDSTERSEAASDRVWSFEDRLAFDWNFNICVATGAGGESAATFDTQMPLGACCQCAGTCEEVEFADCVLHFERTNTGYPGTFDPPATPEPRGKFRFGDGLADTCLTDPACEELGAGEACPGEEAGLPGEVCRARINLNTAGTCDGGERDGLYCCTAADPADCGVFADPGCPDGTCVAALVDDPDQPEALKVSLPYSNLCAPTDGRASFSPANAGGGCVTGSPPEVSTDPRFRHDVWFTYQATAQGRVQVDLCTDFDYDAMVVIYSNRTSECPPCREEGQFSDPPPELMVSQCLDNMCIPSQAAGGDFRLPSLSGPTVERFANEGECFLIRVGGDGSAEPRFQRGTGRLVVRTLPTECFQADPPAADLIQNVASRKNRFLTITTGDENSPINRGRNHAIRVTIESLPAPFDGLAPAELWLGIPTGSGSDVERLSSIAGTGLGGAIPSSDARFTRVARLRCGPPMPQETYYRDWTNLHSCRGGGSGVNATDCDPADPDACGGNPGLCVRDAFVHMYHPLIIPGGEYRVEVIESSCPADSPDSYSLPLVLDTPRFGDVAGGTNCSPPAENTWCASDGNTVVGDVVAAIDTFGNKPIGPIKPRAEAAGLGVSPVDGIIGVSDLVIWVDAVLGKPLTATPMAPDNVPPCGALGGTAAAGQ